jgi:hypothetical protein
MVQTHLNASFRQADNAPFVLILLMQIPVRDHRQSHLHCSETSL